MSEPQTDSAAFQQALLQSERHRIFGITAFLAFFLVVVAIRILVFGSAMSPWGAFIREGGANEIQIGKRELPGAIKDKHDLRTARRSVLTTF